ncbi:AraC family transcriptional regulator [Caulobacter soli]|uniref:AraC family transcriptional regulator n=1 Tax=Caulobacter soli TaxID=2708539 RepID=UPI00196B204E|nr:AraC family transcriptional regulator [Caulobacter soli]
MDQLTEIRALIDRHGREGALETAVSGLTLFVASRTTEVMPIVYQPLLCLIVAGAKNTALGDRFFRYDPGQFLTVSVELPVSGQVVEAPYLALAIALDPAKIAALILETPALATLGSSTGLAVNAAGPDLLDAILRLVRLLDRPGDIPVLAPMLEREVLWRLLQGPAGPMVRQIGLAESRLSQINRAIQWLQANFTAPMQVEDLARLAGMSPASFHRHFKAVTAMSPLQYQKQLRLQAARTLLLSQPGDVAGAGFSVGYDSASQFSREYARLFGAPPGRDAARLRATPQSAFAVA